jgi:hypothetical protein
VVSPDIRLGRVSRGVGFEMRHGWEVWHYYPRLDGIKIEIGIPPALLRVRLQQAISEQKS